MNTPEYPCVSATYESAGGRENAELIFPAGLYLFRVILSLKADPESDYRDNDKMFKWISKIDFVGLEKK